MILDIGHGTAELVERGPGGYRLFVAHNAALERLLFDRNLVGPGFRLACRAASRRFAAHLADEHRPDDTAELMILSKGVVYQLADAVERRHGTTLPLNLVATSRVAVAGDAARVEIGYAQLEAPAGTLLIGDTVASGETIIAAVGHYLRRHHLERLQVVSYAGTLGGARRIAAFCAGHGVEATFLYGLAAFGLGRNGFDLSFLHPETVTRRAYVERAARQFSGRPVSAVGWDFGSQVVCPRKYRSLCWVEAEVWDLHGAPCLALAEEPGDWSDLAHERAAFAHAVSGPPPGRCHDPHRRRQSFRRGLGGQ
ncbi:hypothetical protein Sru01_34930 [Sphaerisporangium rufum]|uniref:Uncharacterized protein n=1 Tax=Sphaerisporangium rufum TaxID=1381558 RepID=A0A919R507_9ACTN|nr:hypothetical protein [Sphaerisporangium rufum]GII78511.1 hypothetical protein Sru01_34930 [Sphaerisporangium rufum]